MSFEPFDILPFRYLDAAGRDLAARHLTEQAVAPGQLLVRQGDPEDRRLFLLLEGEVEAVGADGEVVGRIAPGHYFGERAALFDLPRVFDIRAHGSARVAALPGPVFLRLLEQQPSFAQALGRMLRTKQGVFVHFERFLAELRHGATQGRIHLSRLLPLYRPLVPALHSRSQDEELDLGALSYALARLPANILQTFALLLTDDVPWLYTEARDLFPAVPTAARRRAVYQMLPGKSMVVLRDGWSDLVDLLSCLCILSVEARKLRHRIGGPQRLGALMREEPGALASLSLGTEEREGLERLFPDLSRALVGLATHHEDFTISVIKSLDNYNSDHSERWTNQLAEATRALTGLDPRELPADFGVHLISSNTHSVGNCLSPWLQDRRPELEDWGRAHRPEIAALPWQDPSDRVVALARAWLEAHPEEAAARRAVDRGPGVLHLDQTALTGIGVQLFDLGALADRTVDPALPAVPQSKGLILNIDYAFGQQAEAILASIIDLFGPRIRSINILGKAGGLEGRRGDVMVATAFVEQEDDALHCPPVQVDLERLRGRLPDRTVRQGPLLTVLGTVLQNQVMLQFYRRIWRCIGLEMEGSYYARQILESRQLGALRPDVELRFLYYVSDLPLEPGHTLSGSMALLEGVPPLYAITREILTAIFEDEAQAER